MRALVICVLWSSVARANTQVRFIYVRDAGAESCPDEKTVRLAVAARLGYDPFVDDPAQKLVRALIDQQLPASHSPPARGSDSARSARLADHGHWLRASIDLIDENGELAGTHQLAPHLRGCDQLASAMELAIAIAIDPLRALAPPPPPAPSPTPEASPSPEPIAVPPPAVAVLDAEKIAVRMAAPKIEKLTRSESEPREESAQAQLVGHLAILAAVASAPDATWGIELGLAAQWHRFSVGGELRADVPASRSAGGGTVSTTMVVVNFLPCVRAYGFSFCGLLSGGILIGYGAEFPVDRRTVLGFGGGGARAAYQLQLTKRLAIGLHADLIAPFTRAQLFVDNQEVYHADPVSGAFGLLISGVLR